MNLIKLKIKKMVLVILLLTFLHSTCSFNIINTNYGLEKLGPCSAKLDNGSIIDLSKFNKNKSIKALKTIYF